MRTEGNEGIAPLRFLGLLLFQKSALGDVKIGRAPIRKSLSGGLRRGRRFRAGLRVVIVTKWRTPAMAWPFNQLGETYFDL